MKKEKLVELLDTGLFREFRNKILSDGFYDGFIGRIADHFIANGASNESAEVKIFEAGIRQSVHIVGCFEFYITYEINGDRYYYGEMLSPNCFRLPDMD